MMAGLVNVENQYLNLLRKVVTVGKTRQTRNGKTISLFGEMLSHDMQTGFPLLTTKRVAFSQVVSEFVWMMKGLTDVRWLLEYDNYIWVGDVYKRYMEEKPNSWPDLTKQQFIEKLKNDERYDIWADIGVAYGAQYRAIASNIDQIENLIDDLKNDRFSRRHVVSLWQTQDLESMLLPPCMWSFQAYVDQRQGGKDTLHLMFHIRSSDLPLGLPFNIAFSGLMMLMLCHYTELNMGTIKWTIGDAHIYENQEDGVAEQITREPLQLPWVDFNTEAKSVDFIDVDDFVLSKYISHPRIEFPLSN